MSENGNLNIILVIQHAIYLLQQMLCLYFIHNSFLEASNHHLLETGDGGKEKKERGPNEEFVEKGQGVPPTNDISNHTIKLHYVKNN